MSLLISCATYNTRNSLDLITIDINDEGLTGLNDTNLRAFISIWELKNGKN